MMTRIAVSMIVMGVLAASASAGLLTDPGFDGTMAVKDTNNPNLIVQDQWFTDPALWTVNASNEAEKISSTSGNFLQKIALPAAGDYTVAFDYMASADDDSNAYIKVFVSGGVNWLDFVSVSSTFGDYVEIASNAVLPTATEWTPGSLDFTITPTHVSEEVYLFVMVRQFGASGAKFDNVDIVPEPASMAVLGLGGLAMLRRRR